MVPPARRRLIRELLRNPDVGVIDADSARCLECDNIYNIDKIREHIKEHMTK